MVLLELASKLPKDSYKFVVAHFEHGIRKDSLEDLYLVQKTATSHNLPFVFDHGELGSGASEAKAREARYKFLYRVKQASQAGAIITAHHQDDVIETALLNLQRGTAGRGLGSLQSSAKLIRPLLGYSKKDIQDYANKHKLDWREDSTNTDTKYKRNKIRHKLVPKLTSEQRQELLKMIADSQKQHKEIDKLLPDVSADYLDRGLFTKLPHSVAREVMTRWLASHGVSDISKPKIEKLVTAAKTLQIGKKVDVDKNNQIYIEKTKLALVVKTDTPHQQKT